MFHVEVERYQGPFDVLLQLIEDQKLVITDIALAEVTEQYIKILNTQVKSISAESLADFLVIAARLMLIKSRALLPFLEWEDDDEGDLAHQLKIYKEYLDAMQRIQKMIAQNNVAYAREKLVTDQEITFHPPKTKITTSALYEYFVIVLNRLKPDESITQEVIRRTVSLEQKIEHIREQVTRQAKSRFSEIIKNAKDKGEVVVSFLALLELMKQRMIIVKQSATFDDIEIERFG